MYRQVKQLGRGAFGEVWLCNDASNRKVAMKFIPCDHIHLMNEASKEANLLRDLRHPNIVRWFDHFVQESKFCLVIEYCERGTLTSFMKKGQIPFQLMMKWTNQLLSSLSYLHQMGVIHRDIKPDNILLTDTNDIKLADFGLSKIVESLTPATFATPNVLEEYAHTVCGTKLYMAPEVFEKHYNAKADVFSMGLVLYVMVTRSTMPKKKDVFGVMVDGKFIGEALNEDEDYLDHLFQEQIWNNPQYEELQDLIELMLTPNYQLRPSSEDLNPEVFEEENAEEEEDDEEGTEDEDEEDEEEEEVEEVEEAVEPKVLSAKIKGMNIMEPTGVDLIFGIGKELLSKWINS